MKVTEYISYTINRLPKGHIFTCSDFDAEQRNTEAVIKALNRMTNSGMIVKLSKGKFYKPQTTPFGMLQPNQTQIVKDLLASNGKVTGYLTGLSIYNQLGLTTQISNIIQVGKNEIRPAIRRNQYTISFVKQKNTITNKNIPLLQLLDAIRYIKIIPGTTSSFVCKRFIAIIKDLPKSKKNNLVKLALKYPPATRALLGALLETIGEIKLTTTLRKSLNPITVYKLPGVKKVLPIAEKWNFI